MGIEPFDADPTKSLTVIAVSKEAKTLREERDARPGRARDLSVDHPRAAAPDLIRRAHLTLLSEIEAENRSKCPDTGTF